MRLEVEMAELDGPAADRSELPDDDLDETAGEELSDDGADEAARSESDDESEETTASSVVRTPPPPEVLALGRRIVDTLTDRQAADVVLLDISPMASFADYFVIATGNSERHLVALRDSVDEALDEDGLQPLQIEGEPSTGWVLMDYGDVIVHLFDARTRDYYRLERIWDRASTVVRVL
jgi:ribosome-associated protein